MGKCQEPFRLCKFSLNEKLGYLLIYIDLVSHPCRLRVRKIRTCIHTSTTTTTSTTKTTTTTTTTTNNNNNNKHAFGTVTIGLLKGLEDLEVGGWVETIQTTALLRTTRILRRVLEI